MRKFFSKSILLTLVLFQFASCGPTRNLVYFSDLKSSENYRTTVNTVPIIRLQPNDLLSIRISSLSKESNALFNDGVLETSIPAASTATTEMIVPANSYLVDSKGYINFPVLGKVLVGGLTKDEATAKLTVNIEKYVKSPIITIRLLNFKITVIGEVNKPSSFLVPTERVNILEALGLAGDMTPYGRRENVLLIREVNGVRSTTRLDLNNKKLLDSPYFYLQQNDLIYVVPDRLKEVQASTNTRTITYVTIAASVLVALVFNFQNIFR